MNVLSTTSAAVGLSLSINLLAVVNSQHHRVDPTIDPISIQH